MWFDVKIIDDSYQVSDQECFLTARELTRREGLSRKTSVSIPWLNWSTWFPGSVGSVARRAARKLTEVSDEPAERSERPHRPGSAWRRRGSPAPSTAP